MILFSKLIYSFNNIFPVITIILCDLSLPLKISCRWNQNSLFMFLSKVPLLIVLGLSTTADTLHFTTGFTDVQGYHTLDILLVNYNCFIKCSASCFLFRFKTCLEVNCNVLRLRFVSERYASCLLKPGGLSSVEFLLLNRKKNLSKILFALLMFFSCFSLQPADVYLIDEPSAYLDSEQRLVAAKVIKR